MRPSPSRAEHAARDRRLRRGRRLVVVRRRARRLGCGHIVALHHRPSTSYQIHEENRCLLFSEAALRPDPTAAAGAASSSAVSVSSIESRLLGRPKMFTPASQSAERICTARGGRKPAFFGV